MVMPVFDESEALEEQADAALYEFLDVPAGSPLIVEPGEAFPGLALALEAVPPSTSGVDPTLPVYRLVVRGRREAEMPKCLLVALWHIDCPTPDEAGTLVYWGDPGINQAASREPPERPHFNFPIAANMCDQAWVGAPDTSAVLWWRVVSPGSVSEVKSVLTRGGASPRIHSGKSIPLVELADLALELEGEEGNQFILDGDDDLAVLWQDLFFR